MQKRWILYIAQIFFVPHLSTFPRALCRNTNPRFATLRPCARKALISWLMRSCEKIAVRVHGWMPAYDQTYHWYTSSWQKGSVFSLPGEFQEWWGHPYPSSRLLRAHKLTFLDLKNSWKRNCLSPIETKYRLFFWSFRTPEMAFFILRLWFLHLWWTKKYHSKIRLSQASFVPENMTLSANVQCVKPQGWEVECQPEAGFCDRVFSPIFLGENQGGKWHFKWTALLFYSTITKHEKWGQSSEYMYLTSFTSFTLGGSIGVIQVLLTGCKVPKFPVSQVGKSSIRCFFMGGSQF